jgi:hypothetical protein
MPSGKTMLSADDNVKNLFLIPESAGNGELEYFPRLYIEAKIDFSDVRTGFRETYNLNRVAPLPSGGMEPYWDEDAAGNIDPSRLKASAPENTRCKNLPVHVDRQYISLIETQFIQYLLNSFTVKAYRNFSLRVYSHSGESRNDFVIRCIDLIREPIQYEFDHLHEIFKWKLERLQQKYLERENSEELEKSKQDSRNRELFHRVSERISALFLRTEFSIQRVTYPTGEATGVREFEERLQALHFEAQESVSRILDSYEEKVKSIDEYILHPAMKDIHFVSGGVLWMPAGAV